MTAEIASIHHVFVQFLINAFFSVIGFLLFARTWLYARKIHRLLEETKMVKKWKIATYIVGLVALSYLVNIPLVYFIHDFGMILLLEGLVFLLGAVFTVIVFNLAYKTYDVIYTMP